MDDCKQTKKMIYLTGTRADWGVMASVLKEIEASEELDLVVIATGMHLMPEHGYTIKEIKNSPYKVKIADCVFESDNLTASPIFIGKLIDKLTIIFLKLKPDVVLLLGDRPETIAGALAAKNLNIAIAHFAGGDLSGHVDNKIREMVSSIANIHFTSNLRAAKRLTENSSKCFWRESMADEVVRLKSGYSFCVKCSKPMAETYIKRGLTK